METLLYIGVSNALAATVLAVVAAGVGYLCRRPALVHSLWLLVLLRLVMPPLFSVPIPLTDSASDSVAEPDLTMLREPVAPVAHDASAPDLSIIRSDKPPAEEPEPVRPISGPMVYPTLPFTFWRPVLLALWPLGSVLWLVLACRRCYRFGKLLRYARPANASEQEQIRGLAARLGLRRCPSVWFMPAAVSPMVCALVGAPRLIVPAALWEALSLQQRDTLLVHELAHLRRRDHWVRRLEFVATVLYWWHPVLWWARREIEEAEEQCCDAWVVSLSPAGIPAYAETLVATVTFLSRARAALPLGASGMGHAHSLRRRLIMIMRGTTPKGLSAAGLVAVIVVAAAALPLFPTWAQTTTSDVQDQSATIPPAENTQEPAVTAGRTASEPSTTDRQYGHARVRNPAAEQLSAASDQVELLRAQLQAKQAEASEAKARYEQAQRYLERQERLPTRAAKSREELEQARTDVEVQKARLQAKEAQVKEAEIRLRQALRQLARLQGRLEPGEAIPGRAAPPAGSPENASRPTEAQKASGANLERKQIRFQARSQPWSAILNWLAEQTGMAVVVSAVPEGSFTLYGPPGEKYTIPQVVDMLNGQLKRQAKPMLLIRGKHDFQLIPLDPQRLDPTSLPRVTKNELDQHGDTELVILDLPLKTIMASDVAKELAPNAAPASRKLLGPFGQVLAIPGSNHLILRDTVQTLRNIVRILDDSEEVEKKKSAFKHQCVYIKAKDAERVLKDLLGITASRAVQSAIYISADEASNTIFISGPPDKIELALKTLEKVDVPTAGQPTAPRIVRTYPVPGGSAADVAKALKELYTSASVTVSSVGKDSIIVLAFPDEQEAIEKYLQRTRSQPVIEAIPLFTLEAKKVYDNLKLMFDPNKGPAPMLDVDVARNLILVRGTKEQVTAVRDALKKLGEDASHRGESASGSGLESPRRERRVSRAEIERALKENRAFRQMTAEIDQLQEFLDKAERVYVDKNHPKLQEARQKIKKLNEELMDLRKKLIPGIRQQLAEYHELVGEDVSVDKDQQMKQLEEKLDKLLSEVEALRHQSRTEPQHEGRPR